MSWEGSVIALASVRIDVDAKEASQRRRPSLGIGASSNDGRRLLSSCVECGRYRGCEASALFRIIPGTTASEPLATGYAAPD